MGSGLLSGWGIYDSGGNCPLSSPGAFYGLSVTRSSLINQRTCLCRYLSYALQNLLAGLSINSFRSLFSIPAFCFQPAQLSNTRQSLPAPGNAIACNKPACCIQTPCIAPLSRLAACLP